jgi:hypothetical protein
MYITLAELLIKLHFDDPASTELVYVVTLCLPSFSRQHLLTMARAVMIVLATIVEHRHLVCCLASSYPTKGIVLCSLHQ